MMENLTVVTHTLAVVRPAAGAAGTLAVVGVGSDRAQPRVFVLHHPRFVSLVLETTGLKGHFVTHALAIVCPEA